jgi:branched-chain amino acid transport system ATP-binding protein
MAFLELREISKHFGGLWAVADLKFHLEKGEILGLIGPNGAGKTTVFNLITGVFKPDKGVILFKGSEISGQKPHSLCKQGIARTFQIVKPFPKMTVLENIMVGAYCRTNSKTTAKEKAIRSLEQVGLLPKADALGMDLTAIDLKRVELARALATEPEVLLLDEVLSGLTPRESDLAVVLLKKIRQTSGITMLVIEHVMRALMSLADRVVVIHQGRRIAFGSPKEIGQDQKVIDAYLGEKLIIH